MRAWMSKIVKFGNRKPTQVRFAGTEGLNADFPRTFLALALLPLSQVAKSKDAELQWAGYISINWITSVVDARYLLAQIGTSCFGFHTYDFLWTLWNRGLLVSIPLIKILLTPAFPLVAISRVSTASRFFKNLTGNLKIAGDRIKLWA